ncbi:DegT/DnrJ/EryC1/StrS family aminotransferase [Candidatus Collierbacteria bacterium]|nr:DegT/DnrJ/EryC1/StrS family aminotransferase [Candidatus Collierbacteria bacterium]
MKTYPLAKPFIDAEDKKGVLAVLNSGQLSLGPKYLQFEKDISVYTGAKYACAVSNGTCGLHLAVRALSLGEGDEVITTPFSFVASSNCLLYEKVKPVFADIESLTFNINPKLIEAKITKKTKAIVAVHVFGQPVNMGEILKIANKHKLLIIEDAAESFGSKYNEKYSGTIGDVGVYAFYPNKQMTTGEGGMIVTDSEKIYNLCKSMRNQGRNVNGDWLIHERLGYNYRMDEMSASLGMTQLKKIDWMIAEKRKIANWYNENLHGNKTIVMPSTNSQGSLSLFVYVIRITNGVRDRVMNKLAKKGIQTKPYLPVIHLQPFMRKMFGYKKGDFPVAELMASQTLALPFYIGLNKQDVTYISREIWKALEGS